MIPHLKERNLQTKVCFKQPLPHRTHTNWEIQSKCSSTGLPWRKQTYSFHSDEYKACF